MLESHQDRVQKLELTGKWPFGRWSRQAIISLDVINGNDSFPLAVMPSHRQSRGSSNLKSMDHGSGKLLLEARQKNTENSPTNELAEVSDCRSKGYLRAEGTGETMSDAEEEATSGGSGKRGGGGGGGGAKNHNKYRKDKPWDSASIDHWSIPDWKDETMKVSLPSRSRGRFATKCLRTSASLEKRRKRAEVVGRLDPRQCMVQPCGLDQWSVWSGPAQQY